MKRALIFSFVYYPRFIGGAEVAIKEITDRISPDDIAFDLVALRLDASLPQVEKIGNVTIYRVGFATHHPASPDSLPWYLHLNKYIYPVLAVIRASRLQKKYSYDFIWSMMANYSGFAALLFKFFHPKVPYLLTLQEGDPIDYIKARTRFVAPMFKRIFTRADSVQAISEYLGQFAKDMGYQGVVHIVPNAVDTKLFSAKPDEAKLAELTAKLGKAQGDVFIITTSRLVVKNAVDDIIASLAFLTPRVKFLILGQGYGEAMLKALAKGLGLEERVRFLGYVPHKEMPLYLHASDIFIRPSISEGFGNSFVEAMAADIPVIATPVGGIVDFLRDGETGLFCKVKDPKSIAEQVERLMKDPELKNRIVRNAKEMVEKKYDWDIIARDMRERVFGAL